MKQATITFLISAIILLTLSGCATLMSVSMASQYKHEINYIERNLPDKLKQFAREEGLYPMKYNPNYIVPVIGDLIWLGVTVDIINKGYNIFDSEFLLETLPAEGLYFFLGPGFAFSLNHLFVSPPPPLLYSLDELKDKYLIKQWAENPNMCPIIFVDYKITFGPDPYGLYQRLCLTFKNISNKTIQAFNVRIYGYDRSGNPVNLSAHSETNYINGIVEPAYLSRFSTSTFTWDIYNKEVAKIEVEVISVLYSDGTLWESE
ncbi:DUF5780 domain-containing protein [Kosmotoga sp. DU53]|uniref:DUF5780 domain-containing protein n=1 Tax=Kosmotoga sp. DU53 TaxID=1310160 RepID=UPI0007C4D515|nr:DUF5780 domain-containing protein [Kosmotoga sp. DU53]OAA19218.1 hypothetical protein DU53_11425 [Kosmotoga sp. DU53]